MIVLTSSRKKKVGNIIIILAKKRSRSMKSVVKQHRQNMVQDLNDGGSTIKFGALHLFKYCTALSIWRPQDVNQNCWIDVNRLTAKTAIEGFLSNFKKPANYIHNQEPGCERVSRVNCYTRPRELVVKWRNEHYVRYKFISKRYNEHYVIYIFMSKVVRGITSTTLCTCSWVWL